MEQRGEPAAGESAAVRFPLDASSLSYWNDQANAGVVPDGTFPVFVGDSSVLENLPLYGSLRVARSAGTQSVAVHAPSILQAGPQTVTATFTNNSDLADHDVRLRLSVSTGGAPAARADAAPASNASAGNFDGGGFSFESQQLAANGFGPGDHVAANGAVLTLPNVPAGSPDEITTEGQVVNLGQSGSELGFLGAGTFGTQGGPVTVTYTDGTSQNATISLADWYADSAAPGTEP